jgi:hypothetical protein
MATPDRDAARRNTRMRFEQWARNPTCEANTFSAVHNVRMADVARATGIKPAFGQSPFALARGQSFETSLFARGGERLNQALVESGVLPDGATGFLDLRLRLNGGTRILSLEEAIDATSELLRSLSAREGDLPALVAGATVRIPRGVMLPEAILIIDALVIRTDVEPPRLIVGEVKSYPDRGGYTDPSELAQARAQAGLYVHALEVVAEALDISKLIDIAHEGFLVLTRPGSNWPSIRPREDLRFQAIRAQRGFVLLERAAAMLPEFVAEEGEPVEDQFVQAILSREHRYSEACQSFCDLAPRCHDEAKTHGDAIVLGEDVRRFVGEIRLPRVTQLLDGATPRDDTERDFVRRVQATEVAAVP